MSKQLYEEALADIKKLKEIAEDNAKRDLLEAVTPRIRDLIENQLLGELGEIEADSEKILLDDELANYNAAFQEEMPQEQDLEVLPVASNSSEDSCGCVDNLAVNSAPLDLDQNQTLNPFSDESDEFELSMESAKKLGLLIPLKDKVNIFEENLKSLGKKIASIKNASAVIKESKGYYSTISTIISDVENTYSYLQKEMQKNPKKETYESILENYYTTLNQLTEQKTMKKKNRTKTLSEADVTLKLTGMPDELDLDSIGVDLITGEEDEEGSEEGGDDLDLGGDDEGSESDLDFGGEESEEDSESKMESRRLSDNTIVEIDEGMLRREIARMKKLREEATPSTDGNGPGDVSDDFEDDNYGDPFTDIKLTTETQAEEDEDLDESQEEDLDESQDEDLDEMQMDQGYGGMDQAEKRRAHPGHDEDVMQPNVQKDMPVESLKRRMRNELKIQVESKKKALTAKKLQKEAIAKKQKAKAAKLQEAYNFYARKFNDSVKRASKIKTMLSEAVRKGRTLNSSSRKSAVETDLRNKLAETNLFNSKLLFTNKLLQNESLTKRQKAEIIERLDEAKNEREVKLVYESLVKALQGSAPKKLDESTDRGVTGSSSRPARTGGAANLNEGFEADRWARLAGIVK